MSGKIEVTIAENGTSVSIDYSGLDAMQISNCGEAYGYPSQIPDPNNEGQFIANDMPIMAFVIAAAIDEVNTKRAAVQQAKLNAANEMTIKGEDIN